MPSVRNPAPSRSPGDEFEKNRVHVPYTRRNIPKNLLVRFRKYAPLIISLKNAKKTFISAIKKALCPVDTLRPETYYTKKGVDWLRSRLSGYPEPPVASTQAVI